MRKRAKRLETKLYDSKGKKSKVVRGKIKRN